MKLDLRFNGRYVQGAGGTKLFVEEIGDRAKPSIVWLHGYYQSHFVEVVDRFNTDVKEFMNTL